MVDGQKVEIDVFDLDGTFITENSFHLWIFFILKISTLKPFRFFKICSLLIKRYFKVIKHSQLKKSIILLSKDITSEQIDFFCIKLTALTNKKVLLRFHQAKLNHRLTCLNTAAPAIYAVRFANKIGFDHVFSTESPLSYDSPWQENLSDLKTEIMFRSLPTAKIIYAYSDERSDLPLLKSASNPVLVNPNRDTLDAFRRSGVNAEII